MKQKILSLCLLVILIFVANNIYSKSIRIGSKSFTEAIILAQVARHTLSSQGVSVGPVQTMGGTSFVWRALTNNNIDIYPEYTGTLCEQIFYQDKFECNLENIRKKLQEYNLDLTAPLGFSNSYGLAMRRKHAEKLNITKIEDLKKFLNLRVQVSHEFLNRADGFRALAQLYNLPDKVSAMEHSLAFSGIQENLIDVIEVYTTEAEIKYLDLLVLEDNKNFFPNYGAVFLYRQDLQKSCPDCISYLNKLGGKISPSIMRDMNKKVVFENQKETMVAQEFVEKELNIDIADDFGNSWLLRLYWRTIEHFGMVLISMIFAIFAGVFLGIIAFRLIKLRNFILNFVSILQTIPSLALLVLMIPIFGVGYTPAVVALFLYALLPIVRNTYTGLSSISNSLIESAFVIGLSKSQRLLQIEIPLASRHILSGIKTALIICIGTATLGALIGAGGYGKPILSGIRLLDMGLILEGAIPAALMAFLCQWIFDILDNYLIPKGLRLSESSTKPVGK